MGTLEKKYIRENIQKRLKVLVDNAGSITQFSSDTGLHRVQVSRMLSGSSVPKIDDILLICNTYNVPLSWMNSTQKNDNEIEDINSHNFGMVMQHLVAKKKIGLSNSYIPEGYYILWKEHFFESGYSDGLLGHLTYNGGIGSFRCSMVRQLRAAGALEACGVEDRFCKSVICNSAGTVMMLCSDYEINFMVYGSFQKQLNYNRIQTYGQIYTGEMFPCGESVKPSTYAKPAFLEYVNASTKNLLKAGRRANRWRNDELPDYVKRIFAEIKAQ